MTGGVEDEKERRAATSSGGSLRPSAPAGNRAGDVDRLGYNLVDNSPSIGQSAEGVALLRATWCSTEASKQKRYGGH
jgi:hypothetical protein